MLTSSETSPSHKALGQSGTRLDTCAQCNFYAKWYPLMRKSRRYNRGGASVNMISDLLIYAFRRQLKQYCKVTIEPRHDKPTKWLVRPANTKINLGIRPIWSESSLSTWRKPWVLSYPLSAQRRLRSDWAGVQADLSLRWTLMSFCWFCCATAQLNTTGWT